MPTLRSSEKSSSTLPKPSLTSKKEFFKSDQAIHTDKRRNRNEFSSPFLENSGNSLDILSHEGQQFKRQKSIKLEPSPPSPTGPEEIILEEIGTAIIRMNTQKRQPECDLTEGEKANWTEKSLNLNSTEIFIHQIYDNRLDKLFPIRHPARPECIHPDYADDSNPNICHANVELLEVILPKESKKTIEEILSSSKNLKKNKKKYLEKVSEITAKLVKNIEKELRYFIKKDGTVSIADSIKVNKLDKDNCNIPELYGQYGVFLKNYDNQPLIQQGEFLGFYAGSKIFTPEEDAAYNAAYPEENLNFNPLNLYAADLHVNSKKTVTFAPYGGGNYAQYFNTCFKKTNHCDFLVIQAKFKTANNQLITEKIYIIIQKRKAKENVQLFLDYGPYYVYQPSKKICINPQIKPEPLLYQIGIIDSLNKEVNNENSDRHSIPMLLEDTAPEP